MDSKRSKRQDLLSDLPLSIIHMILSFVPIRDAIRKSILSRKWRYIWSSLPHLAFDDKFVALEDWCDRYKHTLFISRALFLHEGPIHKFELRVSYTEPEYVDQWLIFLSRNGIRILVLESTEQDSWYQLHSSLYSCQHLTHLELFGFKIPPLPTSFNGFLCLRSLNLCTVEVSSSTIEIIVANSPLLEELKLDGHEDLKLTVRAPNLKVFLFQFRALSLSLCTLLEELKGDFTKTKGCFSWEGYASELARKIVWDAECTPNFTYDSLKVIKMKRFCGELEEIELIKFLLARSPVLEKMIYKPDSPLSDLELLKLTAQLQSYSRASTNAEIFILDYLS